ncbi:MAG: nucleoside hydrolase [Bacteroidota bacterium]
MTTMIYSKTENLIYTSDRKAMHLRFKFIARILFSLFFILQSSVFCFAHSGKPRYHVIIDTDGAVDDLRAVTTLLACNDVRVLGIIGSQGTLSAGSSCLKVEDLLSFFHHEGIPVGKGRSIDHPLPEWSKFAQSIPWGDKALMDTAAIPDATALLDRITMNYPAKITIIELGAMTNLADWLMDQPKNQARIERIIWYGRRDLESEFNYQADPDSYEAIRSLPVPLEIVCNDRKDLKWNQEMIQQLAASNSTYAGHLAGYFKQMTVSQRAKSADFELYDDLVPLFLMVPIVFTTVDTNEPAVYALEKDLPNIQIAGLISDLLDSGMKANNRMFTDFPVDSSLYNREVAAILSGTLGEYGLAEWKSAVMTNEIHGHTGIYSIIGVKMGQRALEYYNVGVNNLEAVSYAGNEPPLSCLNDGIQISTGSTIGQGLIRVDPKVLPLPTATFAFNGYKIRIELKKEITDQIGAEIRKGVEEYGMTDKYWSYVEGLAYRYWKELDRHAIFEISVLDEKSADLLHDLTVQWPENRTINLVFNGHSVPAGYFKTPTVNTLEAYPYQVLQELKKLYPYAVVNVIVTAIGGENSEQGAKRFENEVLVYQPDVLFIDYALNDLGIGAYRARQAWESMIRKAQERNIRVILLTPSPDQRIDLLDTGSALQKMADQIIGLAKKYNTGIIDSYTLFQNKVKSGEKVTEYMSQVNHPNAKGHHLIAEEIMKYFK